MKSGIPGPARIVRCLFFLGRCCIFHATSFSSFQQPEERRRSCVNRSQKNFSLPAIAVSTASISSSSSSSACALAAIVESLAATARLSDSPSPDACTRLAVPEHVSLRVPSGLYESLCVMRTNTFYSQQSLTES